MGGDRIRTLEEFVKVHGVLLAASGVPESLHGQLFHKLSTETFDGGDFFEIEPCEEGRQRRLLLTSDFMPKDSHVFLSDHAWTFRLSDARKQLEQVPGLVERMASLMCVDIDSAGGASDVNVAKFNAVEIVETEIRNAKDKGDDTVRWLELEDLHMDDALLLSLDLPSKFPNLLALSLCGNKLENVETVTQEIVKFKHLKALWLNNNPILLKNDDHMADTIFQGCPSLEIYNSCFTCNFGEWALGFCGGIYDKDNPGFFHETDHPLRGVTLLDLSNRSIHNLINKAFSPAEMPSLSHLNLRGNRLDQNERAFQKQPTIFLAKKKVVASKKIKKVKSKAGQTRYFRNVGLGFRTPREAIAGKYIDKKCPFTGNVSIRGRILRGMVVSSKMNKTIIVRRDYLHYIPKYNRYEKRHKNIPAHLSPALKVKNGDVVTIGECRPLSKTVRFNVLKVEPQQVEGLQKKKQFRIF